MSSQNVSRLNSIDLLRGVAMIFVIIFHSSIYNFTNIHKVDFSNPPIIIVLISFMALWGGTFILYSGIVNSYMLKLRNNNIFVGKSFYFLILAGIFYVILHYLLVYIFGRWTLDFENNTPNLTLIPNSIREMSIQLPPLSKLVEGTSLMTMGSNLILISLLLMFLFRKNGQNKLNRNYFIVGIMALSVILLSFVRISLYPVYETAFTENNYLLAGLTSFFLANPYPLIPYLAYGLFGVLIGMFFSDGRRDLMKKILIPLGIFFLAYGLVGAGKFEKSISQADGFWYFKTNIELGLFILLTTITLLIIDGKRLLFDRFRLLRLFSRVSLTIYIFETLLSEFTRIFYKFIYPDWDQTINGSLTFGVFNVFVWCIILLIWSKYDFKYSLEYFWVKIFDKYGKKSTKLDF